MNAFLLISNVLLWILVLGMSFLLLGTLRSLGMLSWQLEEMEATRPVRKGREGLKLGTVAPEFQLPDLEGRDFSLADFSGRRRLLVFVQPGCGPCHDIVPELNALQSSEELHVLGIINGTDAEARQWADEVHAAFPVLRQENWALSKAYKTYATPFGYLVDEHQRITSRGLVGSSQYLSYVLSGAGNESKSHRALSRDTSPDFEPTAEADPRAAAAAGRKELVSA